MEEQMLMTGTAVLKSTEMCQFNQQMIGPLDVDLINTFVYKEAYGWEMRNTYC